MESINYISYGLLQAIHATLLSSPATLLSVMVHI
jgi:hypothetical protein